MAVKVSGVHDGRTGPEHIVIETLYFAFKHPFDCNNWSKKVTFELANFQSVFAHSLFGFLILKSQTLYRAFLFLCVISVLL